MSIPLTSTLQLFIRSQFSMMLRLLIPLALMLALYVAMPGSSANYQLGMDAYNKEDYATAFEQWRSLAEQRGIDAQYSLAHLYYYGKGVPQDYKTAVKWFILAAEQGKQSAQSILGVMYYTGEGVPQDYVRAYMWFNIAASNEFSPDYRDHLAEEMTPQQVEKAQKFAREWVEKHGS